MVTRRIHRFDRWLLVATLLVAISAAALAVRGQLAPPTVALSGSEPGLLPSMHEARPLSRHDDPRSDAAGGGSLALVSFLQDAVASSGALALELRLQKDTTFVPLTAEELLKLNGDHIEQRMQLVIGAPPSASLPAQLTVVAVPDKDQLNQGRVTILSFEATEQRFSAGQATVPLNSRELSLLADQGPRWLFAELIRNGDTTKALQGPPLMIKVDTRGPELLSVELKADLEVSTTAGGERILANPELQLEFAEDDFDPATIEAAGMIKNFSVERIEADGRFKPHPITSVSSTKKVVFGETRPYLVLGLEPLPQGVYRVRVHGEKQGGAASSPLRDRSGNYAGGRGTRGQTQEKVFGANPRPEPGERIEFPEFQPTAPQPDFARRINPADKVETAVVRLYYFRDAHRIAQIVNRTVRSLNRAAVEMAERRAEDARDNAERLTKERRHQERLAVQEAEDLRRFEHEIRNARQAATAASAESERLQSQKTAIEKRIEQLQRQNPNLQDRLAEEHGKLQSAEATLRSLQRQLEALPAAAPPPGAPMDVVARASYASRLLDQVEGQTREDLQQMIAEQTAIVERQRLALRSLEVIQAELDNLEASKAVLEGQITRLDASTTERGVQDLQRDAATQRDLAARANETALQAQEDENLARAKQFRLEVAAANEDPDTYAPAKLDSLDPVAQVSISVIGEGLIQLRGPRKGIDAIRTMIHQMDAPLGQVKVEIVTVQMNGEKGERMEAPVGKAEAFLGLGRFLTSQSLMLLRRAIQEEATQIAMQNDQGGHFQVDRDRKYLYAFFGRDFVDELYEMDSEFLNSENKLLGLHSMDTIGLHHALFVLALARNDVRERILNNFMAKVRTDLVQAEFDYRRSAELFPHKTNAWLPHTDREHREQFSLDGVAYNNLQRYHFRNLLTFFGSLGGSCGVPAEGTADIVAAAPDALNPVQREFLRLAQIFKSRLITELELKQRIIERTMIEDRRLNDLAEEEQARNSLRPRVLELSRQLQHERLNASETLALAREQGVILLAEVQRNTKATASLAMNLARASDVTKQDLTQLFNATNFDKRRLFVPIARDFAALTAQAQNQLRPLSPRTQDVREAWQTIDDLTDEVKTNVSTMDLALKANDPKSLQITLPATLDSVRVASQEILQIVEPTQELWTLLGDGFQMMVEGAQLDKFDYGKVLLGFNRVQEAYDALENPQANRHLFDAAKSIYEAAQRLQTVAVRYENAKQFLSQTRRSLERRKLLDFLIEEQEDKLIDLLEGTRSRIASVDNYLKRLSIALEDDFKLQFYDPAFVQIRRAARQWDVTLSQVERTSILTNNRAFAKVSPQATMEFDLPKRKIAIVEAMDGAKALAQDFGPLLQDPTFLAAYQLMGGALPNGKVQGAYPSLPTSNDEYQMGVSQLPRQSMGAALESLIPDPSIFKFETGTGFEIRPVIQPDGNSIIYDFNYEYTTNIREPVRADEKHLGRIRRHYINTQVQTSSFELRELSRYQVALKAARTAQGVPLLQDIPGVGVLFRPLPSAESSIQQNIILAQSVVYPTVFDLMGLRWAPSVVDLNHISVRDAEHVVRGRKQVLTDSVFDTTTSTVDEVLDIRAMPEHYRPDLYHRQRQPSPYHPGGYIYPGRQPDSDPTGDGFERVDQRPQEMQDPPYDRRFRRPVRFEQPYQSGTYEAGYPSLKLQDPQP